MFLQIAGVDREGLHGTVRTWAHVAGVEAAGRWARRTADQRASQHRRFSPAAAARATADREAAPSRRGLLPGARAMPSRVCGENRWSGPGGILGRARQVSLITGRCFVRTLL
jgi:hypothetical protein